MWEAVAFQDAEEFLASMQRHSCLTTFHLPRFHIKKAPEREVRQGTLSGPPSDRIGRVVRQVLRCRRTSRSLMSKFDGTSGWRVISSFYAAEWLAGQGLRDFNRVK